MQAAAEPLQGPATPAAFHGQATSSAAKEAMASEAAAAGASVIRRRRLHHRRPSRERRSGLGGGLGGCCSLFATQRGRSLLTPSSPPPLSPPLPQQYSTFSNSGSWSLFTGEPGRSYVLWSDGAGFTLTALFGGTADVTYIRALTLSNSGPAAGNSSAALTRVGTQWVLQGEQQLACNSRACEQQGREQGCAGLCTLTPPATASGAAVVADGQAVPAMGSARAGDQITVQVRWTGPTGWGRGSAWAAGALKAHPPRNLPARCPCLQATPVRAGRPIGVVYTTPYLRVRAQQVSGNRGGQGWVAGSPPSLHAPPRGVSPALRLTPVPARLQMSPFNQHLNPPSTWIAWLDA